MAARKVVLVTPADFWELGAGARVHVLAMARYLTEITELTAVYLGANDKSARPMFAHLGLRCGFVALGDPRQVTRDECVRRFAQLCAARQFDVCIVDRVELSYLLAAVPPTTKTILNTHDIVSDAADSMRKFGAATGNELDAAREFAIFALYDAVMAIQEYDYDKIRARIGADRTLLVPYPALSAKLELRPAVRRIGFVASAWKANIDGMDWFAAEVWPRARRSGVELGLYGWIGDHWKAPPDR